MDRLRADRILADWDRVARQVRRPAMPPRSVTTTVLPASMLAGVAVLLVTIAAASVWLVGPGRDGLPGTGAPESSTRGWGPLAVVPPSRAAADALVGGTMRITGKCVFLEEAGGVLALLVWPADRTTWNSDAHAVTFVNQDRSEVTLHDGDRVSLGGGGDSVAESGISGEEWIRQTDWVARPASSCPSDVRWSVADVVSSQ